MVPLPLLARGQLIATLRPLMFVLVRSRPVNLGLLAGGMGRLSRLLYNLAGVQLTLTPGPIILLVQLFVQALFVPCSSVLWLRVILTVR